MNAHEPIGHAWRPLEADAESISRQFSQPLMALANGTVPAFVLRGAYPSGDCTDLMARFTERGYFSPDTVARESQLSGGPYLDLGTSLGRMGADRDEFFAHADRTHALFPRLFAGLADPVQTIYRNLAQLAAGKTVKTAEEVDGRRYGPAIFRIYHGQEGHKAHIDSARRRAKSEYAVSRFAHQFAGILCVQKGTIGSDSIIYRAKSEGKLAEVVERGEFEAYAKAQNLPRVQIELNPGDLYFFYTENIHKLPQIVRDRTRVVLAVFVGMSPEVDEIFVWS